MNACTPMEVRELEKLIASLAYKCGYVSNFIM